jgi:hypothetical protein
MGNAWEFLQLGEGTGAQRQLQSVQLKIPGDRIEAGEPKAMFALLGTSAFNGGP